MARVFVDDASIFNFRDKQGILQINAWSVTQFVLNILKIAGYTNVIFLQGFEWYVMKRLIKTQANRSPEQILYDHGSENMSMPMS